MSARTKIWLLILPLFLTACADADIDELQQWMTEQRAQTRPRVTPIPEPKKFTPQAYLEEGAVDPFSLQRLTQALRQESSGANANAALVEAVPLDSVKMVGSLNKAGQLVALVRVDNLLYQVRPGNYLGQSYGKITKVSETEIVLREIVQDAAGEWIERPAALQLQERSK